ncbi:MAG TPA: alpha/beta fold hydrolase [Streptosporangiaceae bacterium]|nr:alpha/beta fold hydrolase [Streptosporangiaceae bacterium]
MTTTSSAPVSAAEPAEHIIDVRGRRIRVAQAGHGAPLVYLHGAGDLGDWGPALSLLARDFTVYRPDHPGFNHSDDDPSVDTVLDMAFSYLDLFDRLSLDRPGLVGVSLGGWLAAQIAVLAPDRFAKLVLVDAAGLRTEVPTPDVFTLSPVQQAELLYHRADLRAAAVAAAEKITEDPGLFQRYLRNRMASAHLAWNPYMHDPKLPGRLHRLAAPVLVVWGAQDRLLPVEYAHRWVAALGTARLEIIDEAGHLPAVEQPDTFAALVREFLSLGALSPEVGA